MAASTYGTVLRDPVARKVWGATALSEAGDFVGTGALLVAGFLELRTALGSAGVLAAAALPAVMVGALLGRRLDTLPRRGTWMALNLLGGGIVLIPVVVDGYLSLIVTAGLLGAVRAATVAVRSAIIAEGVTDENRGPLLGVLNAGASAGQVVGFVGGAGLALSVGVSAGLLVDAVSFLGGAVLVSRLRLAPSAPRPRAELSAGLRVISQDPVLRLTAALVGFSSIFGALPEALAVDLTSGHRLWGPVVLAAGPVGGVLGNLVVGRLPRLGEWRFQIMHLLWFGAAFLIAATTTGGLQLAVANALIGTGLVWLIGPQLTFLRRVDPARMAQVTGCMIALVVTAEGVGTLALGAAAAHLGPRAAYALAGLALCSSAAFAWLRYALIETSSSDRVAVRPVRAETVPA